MRQTVQFGSIGTKSAGTIHDSPQEARENMSTTNKKLLKSFCWGVLAANIIWFGLCFIFGFATMRPFAGFGPMFLGAVGVAFFMVKVFKVLK